MQEMENLKETLSRNKSPSQRVKKIYRDSRLSDRSWFAGITDTLLR